MLRAQYYYGKSSVRLSVRLSVTLRYRDHIEFFKIGCSLSADPIITDLQGEHPEILAGIGEGIEKAVFSVQKL